MPPRLARHEWKPVRCIVCTAPLARIMRSRADGWDEWPECHGCGGKWDSLEEAMVTHRMRKCSLGAYWTVPTIAVVDKVPELLESGLAIFLECEHTDLLASPAVPQDAKVALFRRRKQACVDELALRRATPGRDAWAGDRAMKRAMA